jgi:hypothetical protein
MPGKPKPIISSSTSERASNYFDVTTMINADWRVITTRTGMAWALQRKVPTSRALPKPTGRRGNPDAPDDACWFGVAYHSKSRDLIRAVIAQAIQIEDAAADLLHELPDQCGGDADPFDTLRADLRQQDGRPRKPPKPRPPKPPTPDVTRECTCGTTFVAPATARNRRYCSARCREAQYYMRTRAQRAGSPVDAPACEQVITPPSIGNNEPHPAFRAGLAQHIKDVRERLGA